MDGPVRRRQVLRRLNRGTEAIAHRWKQQALGEEKDERLRLELEQLRGRHLPRVVSLPRQDLHVHRDRPGGIFQLRQHARGHLRRDAERWLIAPGIADAAHRQPAGVDAARHEQARLDRQHVQVSQRLQVIAVVVAVHRELREDGAHDGGDGGRRAGERVAAAAEIHEPERHHAHGTQHAHIARAGEDEREGQQRHQDAVLQHLAADELGEAPLTLAVPGNRHASLLRWHFQVPQRDEVPQIVMDRVGRYAIAGSSVAQPDADHAATHDNAVRLTARLERRVHHQVLGGATLNARDRVEQDIRHLGRHPLLRRLHRVPADQVEGDDAQQQHVGPHELEEKLVAGRLQPARDGRIAGAEEHETERQRGARRRHIQIDLVALADLERGHPVLFALRAHRQPARPASHVVVQLARDGQIAQPGQLVAATERHHAEGKAGRQRVRLPLDGILHLGTGRAADLLQQHLGDVALGGALVDQPDAEQGRHL
uniref:Uncharacterized protein n=1 Tax=Anopheles atroparvus TaxID=41427 RepID=A0A182J2C2_ANOAO